ncbi:hypothetical protein BC938DRAFT_471941 [Jimgerdemannia flammicorona]|uniref:Uncharacterized protein n=1 Tax=Jimgerdemannia flammicorona TaxID=994334 RepID=A0A433Q708_9FUNG|nr:hypothetical protein BC938DRAFT_471941 [Jimgerdemannia flammicorona]
MRICTGSKNSVRAYVNPPTGATKTLPFWSVVNYSAQNRLLKDKHITQTINSPIPSHPTITPVLARQSSFVRDRSADGRSAVP